MHWIAFSAACLALILARLLRAPGRSGLLTGLGSFALALLATLFVVRMITVPADITRPTDYDAFINHALDQAEAEPGTPIVLFVGASYSRNALDDEKLTTDLRARGYPHRAINLSLEGASLQERDAHLRAFVAALGRAPDVVFIEAAREFDEDPAYVFRVAKFSDRAIEQFSPDASYWAIKGLATGQCDGLAACGKALALLGVHSVMNVANVGLLATGESRSEIDARPSFDPQTDPRDTFTLSNKEIRQALNAGEGFTPGEGPAWARLFRANQRDWMAEQGVRRIAYYYPPVLPAEERSYVAGLCAGELSEFPCIAPVDAALLSALRGQVWYDEKHLLQDGADTYTDWLADQIDRWGALK